jgi:hypothetical protein
MAGLFQSNAPVSQQYDYAIAQIREALRRMPDDQVLANSDDELTDHFYESWKIETIEEDPSRSPTAIEYRRTRRLPHSKHSFGPTQVEVQYARIVLPLAGC